MEKRLIDGDGAGSLVEDTIQVISYFMTRRIGFLSDPVLFCLEGFRYVLQRITKILEDRKSSGEETREILRPEDYRKHAWMHQNINHLIYSRILLWALI